MDSALRKLIIRIRAGVLVCSTMLGSGGLVLPAQTTTPKPAEASKPAAPKLTPEQLDSLVAPIALYPDPLLAQVLAASTYPLQVVESSRWLAQNSTLKGKALVQAAAKQDWEPSIQALVVFPDVIKRMNEDLTWTTDLGNAFLAEQSEVMKAVQRMRTKAKSAGALVTNSQQKVSSETKDNTTYITIEPANPQVIYIPTYNPTVVYGVPPIYAPYPPLYYPPSTGAVVAASMISFGAGIALGAAFSGCCGYAGWGWGCAWGSTSYVHVNNDFMMHYGYSTATYTNRYGTTAWAHNGYYRGGVPYASRGYVTPHGYGAAEAVSPYGAASGVRTPYGSAGAYSSAYGSGSGYRNADGSAWSGTHSSGYTDRTASGTYGQVTTSQGTSQAIRTAQGTTVRSPSGETYSDSARAANYGTHSQSYSGASSWRDSASGSYSGSHSFSQASSSMDHSAFTGASSRDGWGGGSWAKSASSRGWGSGDRSWGGGGWRGGGGGFGGFRGGGGFRR